MFFSIFARGSMTSRPQPVQRILKSMPTRSTLKLDAPQGCFFAGEDGISNCDIHEQLSLLPVPSGTGPYRGPRRFRIGRRIQI